MTEREMNNKLIERIDLVLPDEKFAEFSSLTDVLRDCKAALNKYDTQQQGLIGSRARLLIEISIAESLIEDPNYEMSAIDCEYWNEWHDKLKAALTQQQEAEPFAWTAVDAVELSHFIRKIDGNNSMGAGALAENIVEWLEKQAAQQQVSEVPHIWVLTESYNDYNQHGYYFVAAWTNKPTLQQIAKVCGYTLEGAEHVLAGGGRQGLEEHWYELMEYEQLSAAKEEEPCQK